MTSADPGDPIVLRDQADIRIITINTPHRKNALTPEMRQTLAEVTAGAQSDPSVRAVVITGAGGTFCSGADVGAMEQQTDPEKARARFIDAQNIARGIAGGPTPVIAAVDGMALGAGLSIALACDHIVAARDARFSAAFVKVGLSGDVGVLFTLPQRVGQARARTMMLFGQTVDADEALRIGLVDEIADKGRALDGALAIAAKLASAPPLAIGAIKKAFSELPATLERALETEIALQGPLMGTDDYREAIAAFKEKRNPHFTGT